MSKILNKKTKKAKPIDGATAEAKNEEFYIQVQLFPSKDIDQAIDETVLNGDAWKEGSVLKIGEIKYDILCNLPTVKTLTLPSSIMAGYPVYPKFDAEFVDLSKCDFIWSTGRLRAGEEEEETTQAQASAVLPKNKKKSKIDVSKLEWTEVYRGSHYVPTNSDVTTQLKLVCVPRNAEKEGVDKEAEVVQVQAGPGFCPFENRHIYTQQRAPPGW